MARILFLTQVLPYPLDSGAKIRQYYMIRHLRGQHEITLASFVREDNRPEHFAELEPLCTGVHTVPIKRSRWRDICALAKSLLTGLPAVIARDEDSEMRALLTRLVREERFDIVHADQVSMAQYGLWARSQAPSDATPPKTILDMHNAMYLMLRRLAPTEANLFRRALVWREARLMARYEAAVCRAYNAVLTVTEQDQGYLLDLYSPEQRPALEAKFVAVPICVDPERVSPVSHREGLPTILHLGTMFWPPNIAGVLWFAREALPMVWEHAPEARFVVVGKDPPPEVRALATDPRIEVTGYVEDPLPYLQAADVFIVPLHAAGGMRVKILDAWLWGLPVVATTIGAEGIAVRDGENILLADDAQSFAEAILRLLRDTALNRRLRVEGRAWVETHYAWQEVYQRVDAVYERLFGATEQANDKEAFPIRK